MDVEKYLKEQRDREIKNINDPNKRIEWRLCVYFRHIGRLEALFIADAIDIDRYSELMTEWYQYWPDMEEK